MDTQKNLVMGFATNIKGERIRAFANTLRKVYSPDQCDLVIYTDNANKLDEIAKRYSIQFIYTPNVWSFSKSKIKKILNRLLFIYPSKYLSNLFGPSHNNLFLEVYPMVYKLWGHPQLVRWLHYQEFFKVNKNYNKVLLSDTRDVVFQDKFFEKINDEYLYFFEQDETYGDDNFDTQWYRNSYGSQALPKVEGKPALCCATVMGNSEIIKNFLNIYCSEILRTPFTRGTDQVIFNYLYYSSLLQPIEVKVYPNSGELVLMPVNKISLNRFSVESHGIVNTLGELIPVIHGYDRNRDILNYFSNRLEIGLGMGRSQGLEQ